MPVTAVAGNAQQLSDEERRRERKPAQGGGIFTRKYGPLPGWGWATLAAVGAIGIFWWRSRSKAQAASASAYTATGSAATSTDVSGELATLQSEIQQLQGERATTAGGSTSITTGPITGKPPTEPCPKGMVRGPDGSCVPEPSPVPKPAHKWVIANGKQDIYQIARANGLTEKALLKLNEAQVNLRKYVGTKKPLPKGWHLKVS